MFGVEGFLNAHWLLLCVFSAAAYPPLRLHPEGYGESTRIPDIFGRTGVKKGMKIDSLEAKIRFRQPFGNNWGPL